MEALATITTIETELGAPVVDRDALAAAVGALYAGAVATASAKRDAVADEIAALTTVLSSMHASMEEAPAPVQVRAVGAPGRLPREAAVSRPTGTLSARTRAHNVLDDVV